MVWVFSVSISLLVVLILIGQIGVFLILNNAFKGLPVFLELVRYLLVAKAQPLQENWRLLVLIELTSEEEMASFLINTHIGRPPRGLKGVG